MTGLKIRHMELADVPPCAEILAITPLWERYGVTLDSATARLSGALQEGALIFVAENEHPQVMGFVWVVLRGAFDISGYVRLIGVNPAQRSQGVGRQLLKAAEDFVRPRAKDMFLLCSDFNTDAQHFYIREGYQQVGALADYVIPGVSELIFRKRLPAPDSTS